jgi:hypothetical protein
MILSATTPCNVIEIWQPRWKDRTVLIAKYKVGTHNVVRFTKTKSMPDDYYLSGSEIRQHATTNNGKLECYVVPMDRLETLERS